MNSTIIGVYDDMRSATLARKALLDRGLNESQLRTVEPADMQAGKTRSDYQDEAASIGEQISQFFSSLFGSDDEDKLGPRYLEAVRRGSILVIVDADDEAEVSLAESILSTNQAIDIDERGSQWQKQGWSDYDENAPLYTEDEIRQERSSMEGDTLTEKQEELKVGKRRGAGGRVKVFQRVVEDEVSEDIELEKQRAVVRRRAVDRPVAASDEGAFEEGAVEVEQFSEEAVVEKQTRVTGEVDVGVDRSSTTKTVSDTVRRTEVEVDGDVEVIDKH